MPWRIAAAWNVASATSGGDNSKLDRRVSAERPSLIVASRRRVATSASAAASASASAEDAGNRELPTRAPAPAPKKTPVELFFSAPGDAEKSTRRSGGAATALPGVTGGSPGGSPRAAAAARPGVPIFS